MRQRTPDLSLSARPRDEIERLCMRNLLSSAEDKIFFKDLESRFLLVSKSFDGALGPGCSPEDLIGKTDADVYSRPHAIVAREDELRVIESGQPMIAKVEQETFDDRSDPWVSTTKLPLRDGTGKIVGTWGITRDVSTSVAVEEMLRRQAEGQEEIASLGRLALRGEPIEQLFECAVGAAWRVLGCDCARLLELLPDAGGLIVRAEVGWPDCLIGRPVVRSARPVWDVAVRSDGPVVVDDWHQEDRFDPSDEMVARGVRSTVVALIGDRGSASGVLAAHYTEPNAVPTDAIPFLGALANVLAEAIESRGAQETVRQQALHDGLTGLANRTLFLDRVTHALAVDGRRQRRLGVFFIDLDRFKLVNDSLGHEGGDELLRGVAARLASVIREGDTLARLGGDEFAVLCEELPSEAAATRIAGHLMRAFEQPFSFAGDDRVVSASIGYALSTNRSRPSDMLRDSDAALYHAKRAGRATFVLFDVEMRARVIGRVRTESALRAALANDDEISVHYQPLVSLRSGRIVGAEALARWQHPELGPVSPAEFIPVAEDTGLIHELGAKIVGQAARESAAWQGTPEFAGVAINVSTRQLVEPDEVPLLIRRAIAAEGLDPGFLTVEITESTLIEQLDSAQSALESLKQLGVHLSLDDFGTGYSSLSYLRDLPFDRVKIDRSLISNIVDIPRAGKLAAAIVQMGHALDLQVIAEGVETSAQVALLRSIGCDIGQGFYFARPMAPELLGALLEKRRTWLPRPAGGEWPRGARKGPAATAMAQG
jgi:diguanylate cyclase (GGDEF)-like protein/PAS domain S-box-containing protein